ncbi:endo alpha-1,4 polygalactosaminidase [candidate division WOR-3 bacterium]|nr:endo alpha-1,4 polygalactosaminidase [candidate division WOR-3 bacterium]
MHGIKLCFAVLLVVMTGCSDKNPNEPGPGQSRDYREDMRIFVRKVNSYADSLSPGFIVVPQNGNELITSNGEATGPLETEYISAIEGMGREDLFYGFNQDDVPTPAAERNYMTGFLDRAETNGIEVLVTDYCSTRIFVDSSYQMNFQRDYISFAADRRELNDIPSYPANPYRANLFDVTDLCDAQNFLYLLNSEQYISKNQYINALSSTDFDLLIIDAFFQGTLLTNADVQTLGNKVSGGRRLVLAYMSIGEAENYRYYWKSEWITDPPSWLGEENPDWPGNFRVEYWDPGWQSVIFGNDSSYTKKIIDAGFDGVYLDIIDAFEYYEDN